MALFNTFDLNHIYMIYNMCLCVLPAYKYVICVTMCMQCPLSPGEGIRCPGTGGYVYGYGLSCGC